jgi:hypothetical protein
MQHQEPREREADLLQPKYRKLGICPVGPSWGVLAPITRRHSKILLVACFRRTMGCFKLGLPVRSFHRDQQVLTPRRGIKQGYITLQFREQVDELPPHTVTPQIALPLDKVRRVRVHVGDGVAEVCVPWIERPRESEIPAEVVHEVVGSILERAEEESFANARPYPVLDKGVVAEVCLTGSWDHEGR